MAKKLTNNEVKREIEELYKKGWSPEEIILMFRSTNKSNDYVEKFVMRTIKPMFS